MRKQILALAIFAVLLVAAGGVVSMAQDTSTEVPTVPSDVIDIFQTAGPYCLTMDGLICVPRFYITQVGPNEWLLGGQDIGKSYPDAIDGSVYYEDGLFFIGIESFPVADSSSYAGTRFRGYIDGSGCGYVSWDNPMWGSYGETSWCLVVCPYTSVATSGEDPNEG